jgi:hypothetical protein
VGELREREVGEEAEHEDQMDGVGRVGDPDTGVPQDLGGEPGQGGEGEEAGEEPIRVGRLS